MAYRALLSVLLGCGLGLAAQAQSAPTAPPADAARPLIMRCASSLPPAEKPLLIVDGILTPYAQLGKLNPADIAQITILKDEQAAAIYGSQGRQGVIIVTTKNVAPPRPIRKPMPVKPLLPLSEIR